MSAFDGLATPKLARERERRWAHQDSNLERAGYEPAALTVELWARTILRRPALEKRAKFPAARRVAQLAQRLGFDLTDALARDGEALADLLERVLTAVADAEPHLDDLLFARRERLQHRFGLFLQVQVDDRLGGGDDLAILDEVAKMRIFLLADRRFERDRLLRDLEDLPDLADGDVHPFGDFFGGRLAAELLHEGAGGADQFVDRLDHVHRDADRARLVGNRARDRLPDPPRGVGRELVAAAVLELVHRFHEADVAFLNQVEELQAAVGVFLGDGHDEAEVGFDELFLRLLGLPLAADNRVERPLQFGGRLLERVGHRLELELLILDLALQVFLVVLAQLRFPVLRVEHAVDRFDLALDRFDAFNRVLHLVDEAPLHRLGELDVADALRHIDEGAHRGTTRAAVLALVPRRRALGRVGELQIELLVDVARLAHRFDLLLHLLGAILDALVGDFLVVEDDELADRAITAAQLVAEQDHFLGDERRAGNRLDDGELAALDAPRDLDLALARQERHRAHLAQIHADRVVRLVERARREIELHLLGAFARAVDRFFVAEVFLIGIDDLDARAAKRIEQVVELVRGGDFRGEQLVDFVVQQVPFFLADVDQLSDFVVFFFKCSLQCGPLLATTELQSVEPNDASG